MLGTQNASGNYEGGCEDESSLTYLTKSLNRLLVRTKSAGLACVGRSGSEQDVFLSRGMSHFIYLLPFFIYEATFNCSSQIQETMCVKLKCEFIIFQ